MPTFGGDALPSSLRPQHVSAPAVVVAHVYSAPAEMLENPVPAGGVACPSKLDGPQHASDPSVFTPHECPIPAATAVNVPLGGGAVETAG